MKNYDAFAFESTIGTQVRLARLHVADELPDIALTCIDKACGALAAFWYLGAIDRATYYEVGRWLDAAWHAANRSPRRTDDMTIREDDDPRGDRYDGPREFRPPKGCGGWGAWSGPCGAEDCPSCHPTTWQYANYDADEDAEGECEGPDEEDERCP